MKQIIEVRANFMKFLDKNKEFLNMAEVKFLVHITNYELVNGQLVRRESVEQYGFMADKKAVQGMIQDLQSILTQLEDNG